MNQEMSLSDREREIILGSMLGDGSLKLHRGYANARFSFRHSIKQKEYFDWKVGELKGISGPVNVFLQKKDGWSRVEKLRFQSRALPSLTELYRRTCKKGKLIIERNWLNQLTTLSLLVWWCDDGSIIGGGRKGVFCTDGFEEKAVRRLAQYLKVVWKIKTHVGAINRVRQEETKRYWRLWLSTEELKRFLRIILPELKVPDLLYKFILKYRDSQLQQRWISEVSSLSGFSIQLISRKLKERNQRMI